MKFFIGGKVFNSNFPLRFVVESKKKSEIKVKITKNLPVTLSLRPTKQPKMLARSPTMAVKTPIIPKDTKKHGQPPAKPAGGIKAKII